MRWIPMLLLMAACGSTSHSLFDDGLDTDGPLLDDVPEPYRFVSAAWDIEVVWERYDDGAVTFTLGEGDADGFTVGMAETRSGPYGWYGEDCGPWGGICHDFDDTIGVLLYVDDMFAVVNGETTLFDGGCDGMGDVIDDEGLDRLSFVLWFEGGAWDGQCVIWGDDPSYYDDMGCARL